MRYDTVEYYVELTYKWFAIKFSQTLTDFFSTNSQNPPTNFDKRRIDRPNGSSIGSFYLEINCTFRPYEKVLLLIHAAYQNVMNYSQLGYADWFITLTRELDWVDIFATYVGTNASHAYYDVPDQRFGKPRRVSLGAQGCVIGINHKF